jgi:hypothetical protein
MAKTIICSVIILGLTACASLDQAVCIGTGTCALNPKYTAVSVTRSVSPLPQTVITPQGTYQFVTNQSTGAIMSVVKTSGR